MTLIKLLDFFYFLTYFVSIVITNVLTNDDGVKIEVTIDYI